MRSKREEIRKNAYAYFVSTQTQGRKPFFRHERWARLIVATLDHYAETEYTLHAYVIMPDHFHLLITPATTIEKSVQMIKGGFSFRAKREFAWKGGIWQEGFTDHWIRDEEDWRRHLEYIRQNPIRAGLASESVLYPYMSFPHQEFPQGLKPTSSSDRDVRAEARTLQATDRAGDVRAEARTLHAKHSISPADGKYPSPAKSESLVSAKGEYPSPAKGEYQTGPGKGAMKGTGFSPSAEDASASGASAPEGGQR